MHGIVCLLSLGASQLGHVTVLNHGLSPEIIEYFVAYLSAFCNRCSTAFRRPAGCSPGGGGQSLCVVAGRSKHRQGGQELQAEAAEGFKGPWMNCAPFRRAAFRRRNQCTGQHHAGTHHVTHSLAATRDAAGSGPAQHLCQLQGVGVPRQPARLPSWSPSPPHPGPPGPDQPPPVRFRRHL